MSLLAESKFAGVDRAIRLKRKKEVMLIDRLATRCVCICYSTFYSKDRCCLFCEEQKAQVTARDEMTAMGIPFAV